MEKYAKLLKGLEKCAGPECCKDGCPYYNATTGGMTCRARLLLDANIAITNEQARADAAEMECQAATEELGEERLANSNLEAENDKMREEAKWARDELEKVIEARRSVEAHRDAIDNDLADITREQDKLRKECDILHERCQVQQNEINALLLKMKKTDRPSVFIEKADKLLMEKIKEALKEESYWRGLANAYMDTLTGLYFGEVPGHD